MLALLRKLGTEDQVMWMQQPFINLVEGQTSYPIYHSRLPPPLHLLPSMWTDPTVTVRDLASNARVTWAAITSSDREIEALDGLNALGFLRMMGVTSHLIERLWSFLSLSILNVPLELCSAAALVRFYKLLILNRDLAIGLPKCGLGDLFGPPARAHIERRGGIVCTGVTVEKLALHGGEVKGVTLSDGRTMKANVVVSTAPPDALRAMVPLEWLHRPIFRDLGRFQPCPYISTYLWFDRKLTHHRFWSRVHSRHDLNLDFYDLSNIYPGPETRASLIGSNIIYSHRATHLSDDEIVAMTVQEIAEFLPEAARARVDHHVVNRIPMAVPCPHPGTEALRPDAECGIAGLVLAGDWTKTLCPHPWKGQRCQATWLLSAYCPDTDATGASSRMNSCGRAPR